MREEIKKQVFVKLNRGCKPKERWTVWGKSSLLVFLILSFLGWGLGAQAQEFPARPITLLIGFQPGGSVDTCGRMIAENVTKILGQEIIPVNRAGGGGSVAIGILANSKGDGYTIMAGVSSPLTILPYLESVPYDPLKDIVPIIQYGVSRTALTVRSDSPFNSLKDLIDFARKNPGKVSCGNPGFGNTPHLVMEYLSQDEKVNIAQVPFNGTAPTMVALLGGHVTAAATGPGFLPHLRAGKVKALASFGGERMKSIPDVPTLLELGYRNPPPSEIYVILAPKGTPPDAVEKLERAFRKVMKTQEYRKLADIYEKYVDDPLSIQNLKDAIEKEYAKFGEIIRKTKLGK